MIVHVNSNMIRSNAKHGDNKPPLTVRKNKTAIVNRCHELEIKGASKIVYRPDNPLPCGAKVWVETDAEIKCFNR
jgi:hypothetical protein